VLTSREYRFFHQKLLSVFFLVELLSVQWMREMINDHRTNLSNLSWDKFIIVIHAPIKLFHYILHDRNQHFLERLKLICKEISSVEEINVFWKFSFFNIRTQYRNVVKRSRLKERRCTLVTIAKKSIVSFICKKIALLTLSRKNIEEIFQTRIEMSKTINTSEIYHSRVFPADEIIIILFSIIA